VFPGFCSLGSEFWVLGVSVVRTILHIIRKEFIQIRRDRRMFVMSFLSPVIQLVILGYAANLDVKNIPLLVCDQDHSVTSREFVQRFTSSGQFRLAGYVESPGDVDRPLNRGAASLALVLPPGFENGLRAHRTVAVQAIADGSESNSAGIGLGYAALIVGQYSQQVLLTAFSRSGARLKLPSVNPQVRVWYNPTLRSRNFMVPAVLAMVLLMMTMMFTGLAVVREKEAGTMEQLIVTPIRSYQLIIGKLAPFAVLSLVDVMLVLIVATLWFHVPLRGSIPLLFALCLVFEIATLGLGLLISTVAKTQQEATMTTQFFVMQPMMQLSGFAFPIANMPVVVQFVTYLLPLRYFMTIIRGIFLKGVGMTTLWRDSLSLFVLGCLILGVAIARFRKRLG
jgi:ABC-2 type transport system permease protein